MKRRTFLSSGSAIGLSFLGLQKYLGAAPASRVIEPFGPLLKDPGKLLDLPKGFSYQVISKAGQPMEGGLKVPAKPDGMAAFPGTEGRIILIRNHELALGAFKKGPFDGIFLPLEMDRALFYDAGEHNETPQLGGTTTLVYDPKKRKVVREFLSLAGTDRNCAGGAMPWGSWITCEEPEDLLTDRGRKHGYCFEVKATEDGVLQKAEPLKGLGRFRHEAVALDPRDGAVYVTEDMNDGLLYRFTPDKKGELRAGRLQALAVKDRPGMDLRNYAPGPDTVAEGEDLEVEWIDLDEIDSPNDDLRLRGFKAGAARFARAEGIIFTDGQLYLCCTDGGPKRQGQLFRLKPDSKGDRLELFIQPRKSDLLTNGDNLCAAPWGDLVICEDLINEHSAKTPHLRGITPDGRIYTLAKNAGGKGEFAGSCFSPDGSILFVNLQSSGHTLAITGPWENRQSS